MRTKLEAIFTFDELSTAMGKTAEQSATSQKMKEMFVQARQKQQEKIDIKAMARFEQLTRKDWR